MSEAKRILNADLSGWSEEDLRSALETEVAKLNRRIGLGTTSDRQVGELLWLEMRCKTLGNEIRRRRELSE